MVIDVYNQQYNMLQHIIILRHTQCYHGNIRFYSNYGNTKHISDDKSQGPHTPFNL